MYGEEILEELNDMRVLTIQHQKHLVLINLKIQGQMFKLKAIIDSGADVNMLHKDTMPTKYWRKPLIL